jgi:hypothetical protein
MAIRSALPAIQFYPGDWRKDPGVQSLSFHDRGVWFELLLLMHESERRGVLLLNGQPMPEEAISRVLGLDKQILTTTLTTLLTYGVASVEAETGALYSRRMVRDEEIRNLRAEAGKKGGNPSLLNHAANQKLTTVVKQKPTPSSSSSSSSSSSEDTALRARSARATAEATAPFTGPDISQIAAALVDEILSLHLGGGSRQYAISEAERALFDAVDPAGVADAIREAHRKYRAFWTTERERNPRYYIPRLDGWFQSRDYLAPPSAEVAAPKLAPYEEKRRRADALIEAAFAIRAAKGDRA